MAMPRLPPLMQPLGSSAVDAMYAWEAQRVARSAPTGPKLKKIGSGRLQGSELLSPENFDFPGESATVRGIAVQLGIF